MTQQSLATLCRNVANSMKVNPDLAVAICEQESNYVASAVRYEPNWSYLLEPEKYAKALGISAATEFQLQKFSWGAMQVMGSVARELGYKGHLTEMIIPQTGIFYGCVKLKHLSVKFGDMKDVIAAYNAGNAIKTNGAYSNKGYVDSVLKRIAMIKAIQ